MQSAIQLQLTKNILVGKHDYMFVILKKHFGNQSSHTTKASLIFNKLLVICESFFWSLQVLSATLLRHLGKHESHFLGYI